MLIDLHCHSDHSDGTDTLERLVGKASKKGVSVLSVTDHDTISAQGRAEKLALEHNISYVAGLEISCDYPETLDILGYGYDITSKTMVEELTRLRELRARRNYLMLKKLRELGLDVGDRELEENFSGESLGRPHIASLLIAKGYVATPEEAFRLYIGKGRPGYVEKEKLKIPRAIELVLSNGGLPVLAHPLSLKLDWGDLKRMVLKLKALGLKGLEVFYKEYDEDTREKLLKLARKADLVVTGGSDYHGAHKKQLELGIDVPENVPEKFLIALNHG